MLRHIIFFFSFILLCSCSPETYSPKPAGYFFIDTPQHAYQTFNSPAYPYSFEYPVYAKIEKDTSFFGEKPENPFWINIVFPSIGGTIYISYKEISAKQPLAKLLEDAHQMSFYHSKKADYIEPDKFMNPQGVSGVLFNVGGDAASAYQFIATDSVKHFLRGALYFDVTPNADSLKPLNDFLKADILRMLYTLKWQ
jgi:gliding motility-associated lipoprotein GldD